MKYTKIPETTFKNLQLNAGVLLSAFNPTSATVADESIIGATTGGINFTATPTFSDYGEDIDNCPKNMKELKKLDSWEISQRISRGGKIIPCDGGAIWLKRGQPFAQNMGDESDDLIKRKYLNITAEYMTAD